MNNREFMNQNTESLSEGDLNNKIKKDKLCVGVITDAYHMRGLVKIKTFTTKPENICSLKCSDAFGNVFIIKKGTSKDIYKIDGVESRTEAEKIIGTKIYVERSDLPDIDSADEFYIEDLVGLEVIDMNDNKIGVVSGCFNFGAGDIIEIKSLDGNLDMHLFTVDNFPEVTKKIVRYNV